MEDPMQDSTLPALVVHHTELAASKEVTALGCSCGASGGWKSAMEGRVGSAGVQT